MGTLGELQRFTAQVRESVERTIISWAFQQKIGFVAMRKVLFNESLKTFATSRGGDTTNLEECATVRSEPNLNCLA